MYVPYCLSSIEIHLRSSRDNRDFFISLQQQLAIMSLNGEPRKVASIVTAADYEQLHEHYDFAATVAGDTTNTPNAATATNDAAAAPAAVPTSWQGRMVQKYQAQLNRDYVLADMTTRPGQLGLRWRTREEVASGLGSMTCGNKHCRSQQVKSSLRYSRREELDLYNISSGGTTIGSEAQELKRLRRVPHGLLQRDFLVPFTYTHKGEKKTQEVRLRLCLRCSRRLWLARGEREPARVIRRLWQDEIALAEGNPSSSRPRTKDDDVEKDVSKKRRWTKDDFIEKDVSKKRRKGIREKCKREEKKQKKGK